MDGQSEIREPQDSETLHDIMVPILSLPSKTPVLGIKLTPRSSYDSGNCMRLDQSSYSDIGLRFRLSGIENPTSEDHPEQLLPLHCTDRVSYTPTPQDVGNALSRMRLDQSSYSDIDPQGVWDLRFRWSRIEKPASEDHPEQLLPLQCTDRVSYTPTPQDVGHALKLQCVATNSTTGAEIVHPHSLVTDSVILRPVNPIPRQMKKVYSGPEGYQRFKVVSYNVLASSLATADKHPFCPPWALQWEYRWQTLLAEIIAYNADIVCLQEVEDHHFNEYFVPEFSKCGYEGFYKPKGKRRHSNQGDQEHGCATFFRSDRFDCRQHYELEYDDTSTAAVHSIKYAHSLKPKPLLQSRAKSRFEKRNVALILVLGFKGTREVLCVTNTHIHSNPRAHDVKLWQVNSLLTFLQEKRFNESMPIVVAGDFNSLPNSPVYYLVLDGQLDPAHEKLTVDGYGVFNADKFRHNIPLASAYSSYCEKGMVETAEKSMMGEPGFTNLVKTFKGTVDYIFYTARDLRVESLLKVLDEEEIKEVDGGVLPSRFWPSDHIALLTEFTFIQRAADHV